MKRRFIACFLTITLLFCSAETVFAATANNQTAGNNMDTLSSSEDVSDETLDEGETEYVKQGFVEDETGCYYYDQDIMFVPEKPGIYSIEGASYYFFKNGKVKIVSKAGLYTIEGKTYYFYDDSSVHTVKSQGLDCIGDKTYYFFGDNTIKTVTKSAVYKIGNERYYIFYNDTVKTVEKTGTYKINGRYYYFNADDTIYFPRIGKKKVNGKYYYFREDCSIYVNGWKTINGCYKGFYVASGAKTGRVKIGDYYYYFTDGANLITSKTAKRKILTKNGQYFEIRREAKQDVGGYDTLQGSCTDGTYAYYVLYNRNVEKCKIVKVKISNRKVIKVSKVLNIAHGNGLTYNSKTKQLVAVHNTLRPKTLSVIDSKTLQVKRVVNVKIPSTIPGASKEQIKKIQKFGSISYNRKRNVYVVLLSGSHDLLQLNSNFKPISYTKLSKKPLGVYQCIDVTDNYIMIGLSPKYGDQYNCISIYEWDGKYRFNINIRKGYELESISHVGSTIYAGFYRCFYKPYYTTIKKVYKKNGKKVVKKIRKKEYRLVRSSYVYRISDYKWDIL